VISGGIQLQCIAIVIFLVITLIFI